MNTRCILAAVLLLSVPLLACSVSGGLEPPGYTPSAPGTPPSSPTSAPPPTPQQTPDLSSAVLTLEDLPEGFEPIPLDEWWDEDDTSGQSGTQPSEFVFQHPDYPQFVFGSAVLLADTPEAGTFDLMLHRPTVLLEAVVGEDEYGNILGQSEISVPEDIGDECAGLTLLMDMGQDIPMTRMDIVAFRRNLVGVRIYVWYTDGSLPLLSAEDAARRLDARILDLVGTEPPSEGPTATGAVEAPTALAEGYEWEVDRDLRLAFARPSNWEADKGGFTWPESSMTVTFVAYGRQSQLGAEYPLIQFFSMDQPMRGSPRELIGQVLNINEETLREQEAEILENLANIDIDGEPAAGIVYRATDPRGSRFFSILLALSVPDRAYVFQWVSTTDHEEEMRRIYEEMLPTIRFVE